MKRVHPVVLLAVAMMTMPAALHAQTETKTYTYDLLGRVTGATTERGDGTKSQIDVTYDAAGNRATFSVSGAVAGGQVDPGAGSSSATKAPFVVVPIMGYALIPVG